MGGGTGGTAGAGGGVAGGDGATGAVPGGKGAALPEDGDGGGGKGVGGGDGSGEGIGAGTLMHGQMRTFVGLLLPQGRGSLCDESELDGPGAVLQ